MWAVLNISLNYMLYRIKLWHGHWTFNILCFIVGWCAGRGGGSLWNFALNSKLMWMLCIKSVSKIYTFVKWLFIKCLVVNRCCNLHECFLFLTALTFFGVLGSNTVCCLPFLRTFQNPLVVIWFFGPFAYGLSMVVVSEQSKLRKFNLGYSCHPYQKVYDEFMSSQSKPITYVNDLSDKMIRHRD